MVALAAVRRGLHLAQQRVHLGPVEAAPALTALQTAGWLAEGALVPLEVMKSEAVTLPDGFAILDDRTCGKGAVDYLGDLSPQAPAGDAQAEQTEAEDRQSARLF